MNLLQRVERLEAHVGSPECICGGGPGLFTVGPGEPVPHFEKCPVHGQQPHMVVQLDGAQALETCTRVNGARIFADGSVLPDLQGPE